MVRDGDLATIFNPKRVRAPSVIITSEEVVESERGAGVADRERPNGPPTPLSPRAPLTPQSSISSAPPLTSQPSLQQAYSESAASSQDEERQLRDKKCARSCCSKFAKKVRILDCWRDNILTYISVYNLLSFYLLCELWLLQSYWTYVTICSLHNFINTTQI